MPRDVTPSESSAGVVPHDPRLVNGLARDIELAQSVDLTIWRNRHFLILWLAQAISQTAQNAIWYGIVVLVQQRSHSSTQLSIAVLTLIIPSVVFGVLAGVYVDR